MARTKKIEAKASLSEAASVKSAANHLEISMSEFIREAALKEACKVNMEYLDFSEKK